MQREAALSQPHFPAADATTCSMGTFLPNQMPTPPFLGTCFSNAIRARLPPFPQPTSFTRVSSVNVQQGSVLAPQACASTCHPTLASRGVELCTVCAKSLGFACSPSFILCHLPYSDPPPLPHQTSTPPLNTFLYSYRFSEEKQ